MEWFILIFLATLSAMLVAALTAFLLRSAALNWVVDRTLVRLLKDRYDENLWAVAIGMIRMPPQILMETELRAETGKALERPLGTVRRLPEFSGIVFTPAQLVRPPLGAEAPVNMATLIGPRAKRPLQLQMPIMISALPYGTALSKPFVLALAQGATRAGTAYNAGCGPVPEEVLQETRHLIRQYSGGAWTRERDVLTAAAMLEIRLGQGARSGIGYAIPTSDLPEEARMLMGVEDDKAVMEVPVPGASNPAELRRLVPELRRLIGGGPVGVKLAATHDLERELGAALEAGVDVIAIDGAQAGVHTAPPVLADDFGIPTVHALHRARHFLDRSGARRDVTLIIGGGLRTPAEFLKALALGADAVYVGTAVIMAAAHGQITRTVPFEPVMEIAWATGRKAGQYDPSLGSRNVANFLQACRGEMAEAARALGKASIHDVSRDDLVALDQETAAAMGLQPSWLPPGNRR